MIRRLCLLLLLVLSAGHISLAQRNWGGGVDNETLHFGFTFQYVTSEYKVLKRADWRGPFYDPYDGLPMVPSQLRSISSPVTPGFGLGFVSDLRLGNNANLRFTPGLVFADRVLNYEYDDPAFTIDRKVQSTLVDLPLSFKLKSDRIGNFRAYLIGGAKYSIDIVSKKKRDDSGNIPPEKFLKNVQNTVWYEAGVGLDLYFEFFKLSPELKFAQSARSVLDSRDRPQNPYISPLDRLFVRNIQFSLYFE